MTQPVVKRASKSDIRSLFIPDYYREEVSVCSSNKERMEDWSHEGMKVEVDHKPSCFVLLLPLISLRSMKPKPLKYFKRRLLFLSSIAITTVQINNCCVVNSYFSKVFWNPACFYYTLAEKEALTCSLGIQWEILPPDGDSWWLHQCSFRVHGWGDEWNH